MYDLYLSFALFFMLGALCSLIIREILDFRAQRQQRRDDKIDQLLKEVREMKWGKIDG